MKTVVYQSYRTHDVPKWIEHCMDSVKAWAASRDYEYRFYDDRFFSYAPEWYRKKVNNDVLLVADLARLVLASKLLNEGYQRTIWIDADVIVFEPARFAIDEIKEYGFCKELWVAPDGKKLKAWPKVNNAVMVFTEDNNFLSYYIHACQSIVQHKVEVDRRAAGTGFLTALYQLAPFELIHQVGLFSPYLMKQLAGDQNKKVLSAYAERFRHPIYAANLCASFRNTTCHRVHMDDSLYARVIENLSSSISGLCK